MTSSYSSSSTLRAFHDCCVYISNAVSASNKFGTMCKPRHISQQGRLRNAQAHAEIPNSIIRIGFQYTQFANYSKLTTRRTTRGPGCALAREWRWWTEHTRMIGRPERGEGAVPRCAYCVALCRVRFAANLPRARKHTGHITWFRRILRACARVYSVVWQPTTRSNRSTALVGLCCENQRKDTISQIHATRAYVRTRTYTSIVRYI